MTRAEDEAVSLPTGTADRLNALCRVMKEQGYEDFKIRRAVRLVCDLDSRGVQGIDRFIKKLTDAVRDYQDFLDITKEGRFAIVLACNGFAYVHMEPVHSGPGPDIEAKCGNDIVYFEVTRRRPIGDEWDETRPALPESDTVEAIMSKIDSKLPQLVLGQINVIVLWSSTVRLMPEQLHDAMTAIGNDVARYRWLSAVVETDDEGINIPSWKQYYLFENKSCTRPLTTSLVEKLASLRTEDMPTKLFGQEKNEDQVGSD